MTQNKLINCQVNITSVSFGSDMSVIPKQMEWAGRTYRFIDRGIRIISRRGERTTSTVTMSDGLRNFCLRQVGSGWTLLGVY